MKLKKLNVKKLIGAGIKVVIALVVLAFLGLKSLDFFFFTTPADQWYYAYLGFGLTGGGVIAYLIIFLWDADTSLRKAIAITMLAVCLLGELATAGFGLKVDAWQKGGFQLADSDFESMIFVVQLLGFAHALALLGYVAGDRLAEAFGDEDGDGIPNYRDVDYKQNKSSSQPQSMPRPATQTPRHATQQQQITQYTLPAFLSASGMNSEQAFGTFLDETETFSMAWKVLRDGLSQEGYRQPPNLTHSNFNDLAGKVRQNGNFQKAGQR
jgi:hypothetical protein